MDMNRLLLVNLLISLAIPVFIVLGIFIWKRFKQESYVLEEIEKTFIEYPTESVSFMPIDWGIGEYSTYVAKLLTRKEEGGLEEGEEKDQRKE